MIDFGMAVNVDLLLDEEKIVINNYAKKVGTKNLFTRADNLFTGADNLFTGADNLFTGADNLFTGADNKLSDDLKSITDVNNLHH
jgi:hypothetical protein